MFFFLHHNVFSKAPYASKQPNYQNITKHLDFTHSNLKIYFALLHKELL